eukprot:CAMPEP_0173301728 /NCGR_PEP_ID=MMETSP1143-20121109/17952_1 /TAXON_ID=483371 /ORGANISM="non described non described, Strain CCMP2298" /LENGTH=103 /DNA_ID=CAMNT_0014242273 /DNA_START=477 /DNA_END=785 /DNA_ORIENTATION=+
MVTFRRETSILAESDLDCLDSRGGLVFQSIVDPHGRALAHHHRLHHRAGQDIASRGAEARLDLHVRRLDPVRNALLHRRWHFDSDLDLVLDVPFHHAGAVEPD